MCEPQDQSSCEWVLGVVSYNYICIGLSIHKYLHGGTLNPKTPNACLDYESPTTLYSVITPCGKSQGMY